MADRTTAEFHASHDLELVARAAAGDLAAGEVMGARALVASCATCADLERDLRAIAGAARGLGNAAAVSATRPAPRDFRLTEADAQRLRLRGWLGLGHAIRAIAAPRRARGFGGALATLGLVGLLVSAGIGGPLLGTAGGAIEMTGASKDLASGVPDVGPASTDAAALPQGTPPEQTVAMGREDTRDLDPVTPILAITSGALLLLGIALMLAARRARRPVS